MLVHLVRVLVILLEALHLLEEGLVRRHVLTPLRYLLLLVCSAEVGGELLSLSLFCKGSSTFAVRRASVLNSSMI